MAYKISLSPEALADMQRHAMAGNKKLLAKIETLFLEMERDPRVGTGKPEHLRHNKEETWSRRIDPRHRITYRIYDDTITVAVIATWGHYEG